MESRHVVKLPGASQPSSIVTFQGSPVQDLKGFRLHQRRTLCDNTTVSITLFEICISIHLSIQSFMCFQNSYPTKSQLENHEWKHILKINMSRIFKSEFFRRILQLLLIILIPRSTPYSRAIRCCSTCFFRCTCWPV